MAPKSPQRVRELFDEAMEKPEAERFRFVETACAGDGDLLQSVERLLRAHSASEFFLKTSVGQTARVGRYVIRGELGRGSMGVVYDAIDPLIGRSVAVKVIHLKGAEFEGRSDFLRDRLFREANSAGRLFHPGIIVILDVGQDGELAFIAMERVEGLSLDRMLASRPLFDTSEALSILRQTAAALDYAHERGVIHRDIKPANIMLNGDLSVKVADFGIAKIITGQQATATGVVMGTPSYMSPEQIEARSVDGRSDQFSLVVLAYELLTGSKPFEADTMATLVHLIVYGERPRAHRENPALPEGVDGIFERGLHRLPEQRFATCAEFVAALEGAFQSQKAQLTAPRKSPLRTRTKKAIVLSSILAALSFAALFFALSNGYLKLDFLRKFDNLRTQQLSRKPLLSKLSVPPPAPPAAPAIAEFRVDPSFIEPGQPVTLRWQVNNAREVTIDPDLGVVPPAGNRVSSPSVATTYVLTASNAGGTTRQSVTLEVKAKPIAPAIRARQLYSAAMEKRKRGQTSEAMPLFRQAADLGDTGAMIELGEDYRSGDTLPQSDLEALHWFRRAADAGNSSGMVYLGAMYLLGAGVTNDDDEAQRWFQRAADRGNAAGIYDLATLYESGRGVDRDMQKAEELYRRSAKLGNSEAQNRLSELEHPTGKSKSLKVARK